MSDARIPKPDAIPKLGRVNEICQEWMVREDGAMAYHLQNQEIKQHYSGNKQRNALVREDYPRAKTEQQKEQELAEQAAAVYRRMLEEQEEMDKVLAERLNQKLELERISKRTDEQIDSPNTRKLQDQLVKPPVLRQFKPNREVFQQMGNTVTDSRSFEFMDAQSFKRDLEHSKNSSCSIHPPIAFTEPRFEEVTKKSQEEADAELARMLQEQEGNPEECILERDRLLAIEAQDKELAKVLQERERVKAKKAKEKARQKASAKKQQKLQEMTSNLDVIMPDDAYSDPADMIAPQQARSSKSHPALNGPPQQHEDYEDSYSLPVDEFESIRSERGIPEYPNCTARKEDSPARPSHLNIRPTYKPRFPDPEELSSNQISNIAMAIDPTYTKQDVTPSPSSYLQHYSPTRNVSSKSVARTSPSSSKEIDRKLETNNAPPYMPIQGQKRTASLEKRRVRDGCKQQ